MKLGNTYLCYTSSLAAWNFVVSNASALQIYSSQVVSAVDHTINRHARSGGTSPALTSCGTSPAIVGGDFAGTVTMGTGSPTGCTITFAVAYTNAPVCTVTWRATPLASQSYTTSTTALTLTQTATSSNLIDYMCAARSSAG